MNRNRMTFRALWVVLVALLAVPAQAQTWNETSDGYEATVTRTFTVEPGGSFVIERVVGGISVEAWDQNRVEVQEILRFDDYSRSEAEAYLQEHGSTFEKSGNAVTVRGPNRQNWRDRVQRSYEVRVPAEFSADVQTAGGGINVSGLTGTVEVQTSGGGLNLSDITGDLTARTAGGGINLSNIDGQVDARTSGGGINVEQVTGRLDVATSGGGINIIGVESDVEARTSGGGVNIERVNGRVEARTAGGDMDIADVTRDVFVQTSGGDIELRGLGGRVSARTSGGDIEGRDLGGQVVAETSAGDIDLDDVRGGVEARTSVGDISVGVTLQDFSQSYPMNFETTHGDIELTLPPNIPASIDARVRSLGGGWDRDDIYSDFALSRESPREGRSGDLRSYGDINGGGPTLRLRTSGGSIRIEKGQQ